MLTEGNPQTSAEPSNQDNEAAAIARRGGTFLLIFGAVWAIVGVSGAIALGWVAAGGITTAALVAGALLYVLARGRVVDSSRQPQVMASHKRWFFWVNVAQWLSIAGVIIFWNLTGLPQFIAPTIALVVGLHFWPLARVFDQPAMKTLGVGMSVVAGLGLATAAGFGMEAGQAVAGLGSAVVLWSGTIQPRHLS